MNFHGRDLLSVLISAIPVWVDEIDLVNVNDNLLKVTAILKKQLFFNESWLLQRCNHKN